jgi:hypothetical protein
MNIPLSAPISIEKLLTFCRLARLAKPTIESTMLDCSALPPQDLPLQSMAILSGSVQASAHVIQSYWQLIKDEIWRDHQGASNASADEIELYNMYALQQETCKIIACSILALP